MKNRKVFGIEVLGSEHKDIRRLKRLDEQPIIHGNKFWKSSILIMDYLRKNPPARKAKLLEVGCGWGIAGIYCAKKFNASVTALDADPAVFPYLELHAERNGVEVETKQAKFQQVRKQDLDYDMIIGSDICFWPEITKPLYNLLERASKADVGRMLIADPGRDPFFKMADKACKKLNGELLEWETGGKSSANGFILEIVNQ